MKKLHSFGRVLISVIFLFFLFAIPGSSISASTDAPFIWPLSDQYNIATEGTQRGMINSPFGTRTLNGQSEVHLGVDIPAPIGTPVRAVADGTVITSVRNWNNNTQGWGWGNRVLIQHDNGISTHYTHLNTVSNNVVVGQRVSQGDIIGTVGDSGSPRNVHLHFEVWTANNARANPLPMWHREDALRGTTNPNPLFVELNGRWVFNQNFNPAFPNHNTTTIAGRGSYLRPNSSVSTPPAPITPQPTVVAPDAPAHLGVVRTGDRTARVSWSAVSGAVRYEAEFRSPNTNNQWRADNEFTNNRATSYVVTNLGNYTYGFRVRAINASGTASPWATVTYIHQRDAVINNNIRGEHLTTTVHPINIWYHVVPRSNDVSPISMHPYAVAHTGQSLNRNQTILTTGWTNNTHGNRWYRFEHNGQTHWIYSGNVRVGQPPVNNNNNNVTNNNNVNHNVTVRENNNRTSGITSETVFNFRANTNFDATRVVIEICGGTRFNMNRTNARNWYLNTRLTTSGTRTITVHAYDGNVRRASHSMTVTAQPAQAPTSAAATRVTSVAVNGSSVTVNWNNIPNATRYDIYLVQDPWGWNDIRRSASVAAGVTSHTFTNVPPGYYNAFVITRPNADNVQSNWSNFSVVAPVPSQPTPNVTVRSNNGISGITSETVFQLRANTNFDATRVVITFSGGGQFNMNRTNSRNWYLNTRLTVPGTQTITVHAYDGNVIVASNSMTATTSPR